MGRFVKGDVVVLPFPFSDLTTSKKRPAVVVATLTGDDVLVCQITSKAISDHYGVPVSSTDFTTGKLHRDSNVRPNRLFTADSAIVLYRAGRLRTEKMLEVIAKIIGILTT
jgi:mRNA interferase MazF